MTNTANSECNLFTVHPDTKDAWGDMQMESGWKPWVKI